MLKKHVHERDSRGAACYSTSALAPSDACRDQKWCDTHRVDVGRSAPGQKKLNHLHVVPDDRPEQGCGSQILQRVAEAPGVASPRGAMHAEFGIRIDIRIEQKPDDVLAGEAR